MSSQPAPQLARTLGLTRTTALVVGTIIGASIFVQPSEITGQVPSAGGMLLVWVAAGALTLLGALVTAELASAYPKAGGVYEFLKQSYSPAAGFLWGWAMFWSMHTGIIAAIAMIFARYTAYFVPLGDWGMRATATAAIAALSWVNYVGVRAGSGLQTAFTIGKVGAVVLMIAIGFALGPSAPAPPAPTPLTNSAITAGGFALALIAGLFAYGGWHMVAYAAEETLDPERTIPRALLIGIGVVTASYLLLNGAYLYVLPLETVMASSRVAADAANAVLGSGGAAFMSALVMFSTFGALAGIVLAGPRAYYAMARDGLVFRWLGAVHPRFATPHRATVLQALWAAVLVATGTYRELFTRVIYTEWIFFGAMALGLVLLRRRGDYAPRYRVVGSPTVPLVFALAAALIVLNHVVQEPVESATGLGIVVLGLPVYWLWIARGREGKRQSPV